MMQMPMPIVIRDIKMSDMELIQEIMKAEPGKEVRIEILSSEAKSES